MPLILKFIPSILLSRAEMHFKAFIWITFYLQLEEERLLLTISPDSSFNQRFMLVLLDIYEVEAFCAAAY